MTTIKTKNTLLKTFSALCLSALSPYVLADIPEDTIYLPLVSSYQPIYYVTAYSGDEQSNNIRADGESNFIEGGAGDDNIRALSGRDYIMGGLGGDLIRGDSNDDVIFGEEGNDRLKGDGGRDIIIGGLGNDTLLGGKGKDTFIYARGDGNDLIQKSDTESNIIAPDTILYAEGIAPSDVAISKKGNSLVFTLKDSGETITVAQHFLAQEDGTTTEEIAYVEFTDGTVWQQTDFLDYIANPPVESEEPEEPIETGETLTGTDGDDTLTAGDTNDVLIGLAGKDNLRGNDGNDTLNGGAGNDALRGGNGSDTYLFARGDGKDTLFASDTNEPGSVSEDTLKFADDIAPDDIQVKMLWGDLLFIIKDTGDQFKVRTYYQFDNTAFYGEFKGTLLAELTRVEFNDGTVWGVEDFVALAATDGEDTIVGLNYKDDVIDGGLGRDSLYGLDGDDTLISGADAGSMYGGEGDDTLIGAAGNNGFYGGNGNDRFIVGVDGGVDHFYRTQLHSPSNTDFDTIELLAGIDASSITAYRYNDDLILDLTQHAGQPDKSDLRFIVNGLQLRDYYDAAVEGEIVQSIKRIEFSDGTVWDNDTIIAISENAELLDL